MRGTFIQLFLDFSVIVLLGFVLAFSSPSQAKDDCSQPIESQQLQSTLDQLETSIKAMEIVIFNQQIIELRQQIPCSKELLSRANIARIHRIEAIAAFGDRNMKMLQAYSRSANAIEPEHRVGKGVFLVGHPIHLRVSVGLDAPEVATKALPQPRVGDIWIDGLRTLESPQDRPYLFQHSVNNELIRTAMVEVGGQPDYQVLSAAWTPLGERFPRNFKLQPELTMAAACTAALALGSALASNWRTGQFWDPTTPDLELSGLRNEVNALSGAALGFGGLSVGLIVSAGVTGNW